jgi:hypothetical protein
VLDELLAITPCRQGHDAHGALLHCCGPVLLESKKYCTRFIHGYSTRSVLNTDSDTQTYSASPLWSVNAHWKMLLARMRIKNRRLKRGGGRFGGGSVPSCPRGRLCLLWWHKPRDAVAIHGRMVVGAALPYSSSAWRREEGFARQVDDFQVYNPTGHECGRVW